MADEPHTSDPEQRSRSTGDLHEDADPPYAVVRPAARRIALLSYLGPVIVLFAVVGIALIYWVNRGAVAPNGQRDRDAVGTFGRDGGGTADPDFDSTRDEIRYRGGKDSADQASGATATTIAQALRLDASRAQSVALSGVRVAGTEGDVVWVTDGERRVAVVRPPGADLPRTNDRIDVAGMSERDSLGGVRIRATRLAVR